MCHASICADHRVVGLDPADPIEVSYGKPIAGEPTGKANPEILKMHPSHGHDMSIVNGISRIGHMKGGKSALWKDEDMADVFTRRGGEVHRANTSKAILPVLCPARPARAARAAPAFRRQDGAWARAATPSCRPIGAWAKSSNTLDRLKLSENTLVIVTSDNGPVVDDGYQDEAVTKLGDHRRGDRCAAANTASSRPARACRSSCAGRVA